MCRSNITRNISQAFLDTWGANILSNIKISDFSKCDYGPRSIFYIFKFKSCFVVSKNSGISIKDKYKRFNKNFFSLINTSAIHFCFVPICKYINPTIKNTFHQYPVVFVISHDRIYGFHNLYFLTTNIAVDL